VDRAPPRLQGLLSAPLHPGGSGGCGEPALIEEGALLRSAVTASARIPVRESRHPISPILTDCTVACLWTGSGCEDVAAAWLQGSARLQRHGASPARKDYRR